MFKYWLRLFLSTAFFALPFLVFAQETTERADFSNPLKTASLPTLIGTVIQRGFLGIVGSIGFLAIIVGGLLWLTAAGNAERIETAKTILVWAILGMAVIFGAYTIVTAIFRILPGAFI